MTVAVARELTKRKKKHVDYGALLIQQCVDAGLPAPRREYQFHHRRLFRFDLSWLPYQLAVEIDGGGFMPKGGGRHSRGLGMEEDCEKLFYAVTCGWRVIRTTPRQIKKGITLGWLRILFLKLPKPTTTQPPAGGTRHVATR